MEQIKSTGLVLSEKKNLVQILIGSHRLLFSMKFPYLFHAAPNCKQKDLKNMLVDNLLPELKLKQSNILTMGDFNFDLQNKNFRFSEFKQIKSTGLVLSEKNKLVQIPIGSHRLLFSMKFP
jgi:hypothetical protein